MLLNINVTDYLFKKRNNTKYLYVSWSLRDKKKKFQFKTINTKYNYPIFFIKMRLVPTHLVILDNYFN